MSDDLERRLREAGHRLPGPTDLETRRARAAVLAARDRRPRRLVPLLAAAVLVAGGAFGVGYAVAGGGKPKPTHVFLRNPVARLQLGPGFLPSPGWHTIVWVDPQSGSITQATAKNANGTSIGAHFAPASQRPHAPRALLPLRLPSGGKVRDFTVHVGAYAISVNVVFTSLSPAAVASAREELGRLTAPSCPAALPITQSDVAAAKAYVLAWLPSHYAGEAGDTAGATATARLGGGMPRHGQAVADCGARVAARSVEVDVTLPRLATVSASLSQLTYFVAKAAGGWTVWDRAR